MEAQECYAMQRIDGDDRFNDTGLEKFMKNAKVAERGRSYEAVAITGPQISRKWTDLSL